MGNDWSSASHVAGHAIVGEILGFECLGVTIRWTDQHLGVCRWPAMPDHVFDQLQFQRYGPDDDEFNAIKDWVIRRTKSYLAGSVAEDHLTGDFEAAWLTSDLNMISVVTRNVFGLEGPSFDEQMTSEIYYDVDLGLELEDLQRVVHRARELWEVEVREMVAANQKWLRDVAELLNKEKALSGDAVRSLQVSG
tara:strand:- start:9169 stop:9747 length:579 start_codon:yes stop_codon:yes gene_type:complete